MRSARFALAALAAFLVPRPAAPAEAEAVILRAHCEASPSTERICDCLLRQFGKLGDDQQALVVALIEEDAAAADVLRGALSAEDAGVAESLMARETLLCRPSG